MKNEARTLAKDLEQRAAALKATLKAIAKSLPTDPSVRTLGRNCAIVMSSKMFEVNNWSPSYWLPLAMSQTLCDVIDRARPENLRRLMVRMIRTGIYVDSTKTRHTLHPAALKALRQAWLH
jgi:glutamate-1-semialdehyde aminotransferase